MTGHLRSEFASVTFAKIWVRPEREEIPDPNPKKVKQMMEAAKGLDLSEIWEPYLRRPKTAICPVFWEGDTEMEHIGSGVLIEIGDAHFLLSAAHVTEQRHKYPLFIPSKDGFINVFGLFIESPLPKTGLRKDDRSDIACVRLDPKIVRNLHDNLQFLDADDCDLHDVTAPQDVYTVIGYPSRKSGRDDNRLSTEMFSLSGDGVMDYRFDRLKLNPERNILIQHRFKKTVNYSTMLRKQPPHPEGMSGGGIFAWSKALPNLKALSQPKLVAILTEYHQEHNVFVGSRLSIHLNAIHRSDPSLPIVPLRKR